MRNIFAIVALVVLALVCAIRPIGDWLLGTPPDRISPGAFTSDPLVRRLAIAVDRGDEPAIAAAVKVGADVNAFGSSGFRLLDWAMARNNPRGFEALLEQGASLDALYRDPKTVPDRSYNLTILERVLGTNSGEFIGVVLRSGVDLDHVPFPDDGRSLLFFASDARAPRVVDALLDKGAAIDYRDNSGNTPLFDAMLMRNYTTAWHLLRRGADPTAQNRHGNDFVWGLKEYGSRGVRPDQWEYFEKVVDELVKRGLLTRQDIVEADKPKTPNSGITVIEHAPDSEAGQELLRLDQAEREFVERQMREKMSQ